jgi:hypothetical protein
MAELSYFFNSSVDNPKTYEAKAFADIFSALAGREDGYLKGYGGELKITANGTNLNVTVSSGAALVGGRLYINAESKILTIDYGSSDRADRIIVRLNETTKTLETVVKKGASSVPFALERSSTIYEISLARIIYRGGSNVVAITDIIDERDQDSYCGMLLPLRHSHIELSNILNGTTKVAKTVDADNASTLGGKTEAQIISAFNSLHKYEYIGTEKQNITVDEFFDHFIVSLRVGKNGGTYNTVNTTIPRIMLNSIYKSFQLIDSINSGGSTLYRQISFSAKLTNGVLYVDYGYGTDEPVVIYGFRVK